MKTTRMLVVVALISLTNRGGASAEPRDEVELAKMRVALRKQTLDAATTGEATAARELRNALDESNRDKAGVAAADARLRALRQKAAAGAVGLDEVREAEASLQVALAVLTQATNRVGQRDAESKSAAQLVDAARADLALAEADLRRLLAGRVKADASGAVPVSSSCLSAKNCTPSTRTAGWW